MNRCALGLGLLAIACAANADVNLKDAHVRGDEGVVLIVGGAAGDIANVDSELAGRVSTYHLGPKGELQLGLPAPGLFHIGIQPKFLKSRSVFLLSTPSGDGFDLSVFDASDERVAGIDPTLISKFWTGLSLDALKNSVDPAGSAWLAAHPKTPLLKGSNWILCMSPGSKLECIFGSPDSASDASSFTNAVLNDACDRLDGLSADDKKALHAYLSAGAVFSVSKEGLDYLVKAAASSQTALADGDRSSIAVGPVMGTARNFKMAWKVVKKEALRG